MLPATGTRHVSVRDQEGIASSWLLTVVITKQISPSLHKNTQAKRNPQSSPTDNHPPGHHRLSECSISKKTSIHFVLSIDPLDRTSGSRQASQAERWSFPIKSCSASGGREQISITSLTFRAKKPSKRSLNKKLHHLAHYQSQ